MLLSSRRDKLLSYIQKALLRQGFLLFYRAVQFLKNGAVLFTFCRFYGIIQLIDKLEFDEWR